MNLDTAVLDANVGEIMFLFFGFWLAIWWTYVGLIWALRLLAGMRFKERW